MTTTFRREILGVFALLLACPILIHAQGHTTQQLYGGFSYVRTDDHPNVDAFGWEALYSEYPYTSFRWIGASLEANGVYAGPVVKVEGQTVSGLLHNQIYTFMGGPSFKAPTLKVPLLKKYSISRLQPFAHLLMGAVLTNVDTTGRGALYFGHPISESNTAFGLAAGGGIDVYVNRTISLRGNVDWLRSSFEDQHIDRQNSLRSSVGIVTKF